MSGGDDPFGRSDRTIIRPNPGGRLPQTPVAADAAASLHAPARRRGPGLAAAILRRVSRRPGHTSLTHG